MLYTKIFTHIGTVVSYLVLRGKKHVEVSCNYLLPCHDGIWESGGIAPCILNLGTICFISKPLYLIAQLLGDFGDSLDKVHHRKKPSLPFPWNYALFPQLPNPQPSHYTD